MKKLLISVALFALISSNALAQEGYENFYEQGSQYLKNFQYSSAIGEFKKALRLDPFDYNSKICIINAYLARATYYNNKSYEYDKAANDLRSALFYLKYYDDATPELQVQDAIKTTEKNLNGILNQFQTNMNAQARFNTAKTLRTQGEFAASAMEFQYASTDRTYQKESYAAIGDMMGLLGNWQKAVHYYEKAAALDSGNIDLRSRLARAYEISGDAAKAANEFNWVLSNASQNDAVVNSLEKIWLQKVQQNPTDAQSLANLGVVYQKKGDFALAEQYYQKAERLDPTNVNTRYNYGTLFQLQKNYPAALEAYSSILALYPNHVQARVSKAQCLDALKNRNEAITEYNRVLGFDPNNEIAKAQIYELSKAVLSEEDLLHFLKQKTEQNPNNWEICYDYAYELHKNKRYEEAIIYYQKSAKLNPNNVDAYINLAQIYKYKEDYPSAISTLKRAQAVAPAEMKMADKVAELQKEYADLLYSQGSELFLEEKYDEAILTYNKINPQSLEVILGIAACYQAKNDYNKALSYYQKSFALEPNNSDMAYYVGLSYSNLDDAKNAIIYLNKAVSLDNNNEKAKDLLVYVREQQNSEFLERALALYEEQKYDQALAILSNILSSDNKNAFAYYYRGLVFDAQKKYQQAITDYQNALKFNSDLNIVYYSLAVDFDTLNKYKEASAAYKKYVELSGGEENEYVEYSKNRILELEPYAK